MNKCPDCGREGDGAFCPNCGIKMVTPSALAVKPPTVEEQEATFAQYDLPKETPIVAYPVRSTQEVAIPVGALQPHLRDTTAHATTELGAIIHSDGRDEGMVWSGRPAPFAAMTRAIPWGIGLIAPLLLGIVTHSWLIFVAPFVFGAWRVGSYYFALQSMRYRMTSQRLEVTDGLMHQQMRAYEVHHLGDATIDSPIMLRFFGLSNLTVQHFYGTGGKHIPVRVMEKIADEKLTPSQITMVGIPTTEAVYLRDVLRNAGQNEAGRWDKFRVR